MIEKIIWGLVTGTETPLDGLTLMLAKYENDEDWHLIGNNEKDDENVMKFFHETACRNMSFEEFKKIWDSGEFETPGGGTAIINPINVEVISVVEDKGCDESSLDG